MAQKTDAELTTESQVIRDETVELANTKTRVYNILKNIIDSKPNNDVGLIESVTGTGVDNTDPLNPVIGLANGLPVVDTTGVAISFAVPQIYGSVGTPETGNITIVTTGLVKGMTQLLIHNNGTEPTYGAEIQIISGAYVTGVDNYIMLLAVSTTLILVTISQELV